MRRALCKDMGSFCKAIHEAFQSSRAADSYCIEFLTDVLRLALQHERQDLPFRITIFSELCLHARRLNFVFDVLQSLVDQCRYVRFCQMRVLESNQGSAAACKQCCLICDAQRRT
jgi:hypothetical protein